MRKSLKAIVFAVAACIGMTITSFAGNTTEEKESFVSTYQRMLDETTALCANYTAKDVFWRTGAPGGIDFEEMQKELPYDGLCYPSENGIALKLYENGRIYYGEVVDGVPNGQGTLYAKRLPGQWIRGTYKGIWINGAPNGEGTENLSFFDRDGKVRYLTITGVYTDWYQNGEMTVEFLNKESGSTKRTYEYTVVDKIPQVIDTKETDLGEASIVASAKEKSNSFLTYFDTPQTVLHLAVDDGIKKNEYYFINTGISD